jgi:acyl carrier protein
MGLPEPFELVARALQCPLETLRVDSGLNRHPKWDSMGHLEIIMALEQSYAIQISEETIRRFESMSTIIEYYEKLKGRP